MASDLALTDELGLKRALEQARAEVIAGVVHGLNETEIGVTGVFAAIADSGTLLLGVAWRDLFILNCIWAEDYLKNLNRGRTAIHPKEYSSFGLKKQGGRKKIDFCPFQGLK